MPILKNARWEAFAQGLAKRMTADEAYAKAGYKPSRAHASRLAAKGNIRARVAELTAPAVAKAEVTVERVLEEMARLAFYDATTVLDMIDGKVLVCADPRQLPEDVRRAIVSFEPVKLDDGIHYKCKLADKQKALDSLARHLQMFKDTVVIENVFRVVKEMDDDELTRRLAELERAVEEATTLDPAPGGGAPSLH